MTRRMSVFASFAFLLISVSPVWAQAVNMDHNPRATLEFQSGDPVLLDYLKFNVGEVSGSYTFSTGELAVAQDTPFSTLNIARIDNPDTTEEQTYTATLSITITGEGGQDTKTISLPATITETVTVPGGIQRQTKFIQACWRVTGSGQEQCHPEELVVVIDGAE